MYVRPQIMTNLFRQSRVLFQELDYTVCKLRVIHAQALDFVKGNKHARQEEFVFFFERERKSIDDGTKDLEEFGDTIEAFGLVHELEEDIVDRPPDKRSEVQKFAIYPVEGSLQEVSFSGVFRIEEFKQLKNHISSWATTYRPRNIPTCSTKL